MPDLREDEWNIILYEICVVVRNFGSVCSSCVWLCLAVSVLAPKFPVTCMLHRSKLRNSAEMPIFNSLRVASDIGELRLVFACLALNVFRFLHLVLLSSILISRVY